MKNKVGNHLFFLLSGRKKIMRCYVEGRAKTTADSIMINYIEAKKDGKLFVLDWDETELGFDEECDAFGYKKFSGRLKGIKFNDEYANGRMGEIRGADLTEIQVGIPDPTFLIETLKFNTILLDDEGDLYAFDTEDSNIMYCVEVYED